jgi:hypothetical protein
MTTPSRRLRRKIDLLMPECAAAAEVLSAHPELRKLYPEMLVVNHQQIRATVPLTKAALARCRELGAADPVAAGMVAYLEEHITEEAGHDEWVLEDLEVLGVRREEVRMRVPSPTVASFVGSQYYWVLHHHPVALLGHVTVREGYPTSAAAVEALAARTGYPRAALRTMERHGQLDVGHGDHLAELLDALPLTGEHEALLGLSALHTLHLSIQTLREVMEPAPPG